MNLLITSLLDTIQRPFADSSVFRRYLRKRAISSSNVESTHSDDTTDVLGGPASNLYWKQSYAANRTRQISKKTPQLTKSSRRIRTRRRLVRDRLAYLGGCAAPISKRCPAGVPDRGPSPQLVCTDTRAHDPQMAPPWLRVGNPTQPWGRDDPNCVFLFLLSVCDCDATPD